MDELQVRLEPLTRAEQRERERLERRVQDAVAAGLEAGFALREIRDERLYRSTHTTFEDYARELFEYSRARAYQLIDAARVSTIVDIRNEGQARELVSVLRDEGEDAVREIVESLGDETLTAARLRAARLERAGEAPRRATRSRRRVRLSYRYGQHVLRTRHARAATRGWPAMRVSVNPDEDFRIYVRDLADQLEATVDDDSGTYLDLAGVSNAMVDHILSGRWEQPGVRDYACVLARLLLAQGARGLRLRRDPVGANA